MRCRGGRWLGVGALLLCSEGDFREGGNQQAPRTGLLTNGRMLWAGVCAVKLRGG